MKKTILLLVLVVIIFLVIKSKSEYEPFNPTREPPQYVPDILDHKECECLIEYREECPVMTKITQLASELSGKPIENCEKPIILKNNSGGERPLCYINDSCSEFRDLGGERIGCLVVYLNNDFEGGELFFESNGGMKIKPEAGSGVYYRPLLTHRNVHKGLPVKAGTKYTCVVFVREQHSDKISVE
jgi:hypothetical protein